MLIKYQEYANAIVGTSHRVQRNVQNAHKYAHHVHQEHHAHHVIYPTIDSCRTDNVYALKIISLKMEMRCARRKLMF